MGILRRLMAHLWKSAYLINKQNILKLAAEAKSKAKAPRLFLDLGCDNGEWTIEVARHFGADRVHGVEIVKERRELAKANGVTVYESDLNHELRGISDSSITLVHANMVIEHIEKLDNFMSEVHRVVQPGGFAIMSTENGSSWHNIVAAIMGWQLFSSTNITVRANIGNPLALYRNEPMTAAPSMMHKTIFNYRGFIEFFEAHGFIVEKVLGAGYYPFPSWVGQVDVRHSHFIVVLLQKK